MGFREVEVQSLNMIRDKPNCLCSKFPPCQNQLAHHTALVDRKHRGIPPSHPIPSQSRVTGRDHLLPTRSVVGQHNLSQLIVSCWKANNVPALNPFRCRATRRMQAASMVRPITLQQEPLCRFVPPLNQLHSTLFLATTHLCPGLTSAPRRASSDGKTITGCVRRPPNAEKLRITQVTRSPESDRAVNPRRSALELE